MDQTNPPGYPPPPPPPPGASGEPVPPGGSFQRPADYYSNQAPPPQQGKSGCPKWLLFGCGGLGCLGLILIFVGGAWMMRGGGGMLSKFIVSQLEKDADRLFEADVAPEARATLKAELARLKENIDADRLDLMALQPLLTEMNEAIRDRSLTAAEVDALNEELLRLNEEAAGPVTSTRLPRPPSGFENGPALFAQAA